MKPFNETTKKEFLEVLDRRLTLVGLMRFRLLDYAAAYLQRADTLSQLLVFLATESESSADPDVGAMLAHIRISAEEYFG